jgi:[acyl-carrier-protein] S-malonyltransferase
LGEYNHLVEIGALSFPAALRLLEARGTAYESAPAGAMVSVFPCDEVQVREALNREEANGLVDISIHLAKKHFVLGGEARSVEFAAAWLEEEAFTHAQLIDPRLPMHARIFKPVAVAFREALECAEWQLPRLPYLSNTTGDFLEEPSSGDFVDRLYRHVFSTVQWTRSIESVLQRFPDAALVEVGPKAVLYNQLSREYRNIPVFRVDDETDLAGNFRSVTLKLAS